MSRLESLGLGGGRTRREKGHRNTGPRGETAWRSGFERRDNAPD